MEGKKPELELASKFLVKLKPAAEHDPIRIRILLALPQLAKPVR
jgi:hypothetical protein